MNQDSNSVPYDTFENLQNNASSLLDVQQWFNRHPEILLGKLQLPSEAQLVIDLGIIDSTLLKNAFDIDSVDILIKCEFFYPLTPTDDVAKALFDGNAEEVQTFTSRRIFEMPLTAWPLATTLVVEKYMAQGLHLSNIEVDMLMGEHIDTHIHQHFPGWSINKIEAMLGAGLLASDKMGKPEQGAVTKLLFSNRARIDTSLPADFSMENLV